MIKNKLLLTGTYFYYTILHSLEIVLNSPYRAIFGGIPHERTKHSHTAQGWGLEGDDQQSGNLPDFRPRHQTRRCRFNGLHRNHRPESDDPGRRGDERGHADHHIRSGPVVSLRRV